jgi:hypothetical protein
MARQSAASLSVIAGSIDGRPNTPDDLTDEQRVIWERTVATEGADTFKTSALQALLKDYCRHAAEAGRLAKVIEAFDTSWLADEEGLRRYDRLAAMRFRETKGAADMATKLRLTNQARYTPGSAATAAKKAGTALKPWEFTG